MATKFFIGGNEFYNDALAAEDALEAFRVKYGIPEDAFTIVQIDQAPPEVPVTVN